MVQKIAAASALLYAGSALAALDPIVVKGSKFFFENGTQFFMKGIAYQEDPEGAGGENANGKYTDPLADEKKCKRDIPIMKAAGTNTIRVYSIDPEQDHDACFKMLDDAGIYVVADLGEPAQSINRDDPGWNVDLFKRYKDVIDVMAPYSNVIGFFAGNEVSNNATNTDASAYVKAAVRDSKQYIKDQDYRWMGVGYATNDDAEIRVPMSKYFNCGDQDAAIDFWGYNIYSWCEESTFEESGYDKQTEFFSNYSVPVFLAEYGCNKPGGAEKRLFQDTTVLYSDKMSHVFSGGIVYMYHQEENDYGLVKFKGDGEATIMDNYKVLSSRVNAATASSTSSDAYTPTNSPAVCPGISDNWKVSSNAMPPTPDSELCDCMYSTLKCIPASNLRLTSYGEVFGFICGNDPESCAGISNNATTGIYGAYSMCNDTVKLAHVMNTYFENNGAGPAECDHDGAARLLDEAPGAASSCSSKLESASSSVEWAATATGALATNGAGGSQNDDDSFGVAARRMDAVFSLGSYAVGLYVVVAAGVGGAMLML